MSDQAESGQFSDIVRRVDGLWMGKLDPRHIELIENDVVARQQALHDRAAELEEKLHNDLQQGVVDDLENDHDEFRHTEYEFNRLEQVRKRLYNKRQRRIIWTELKKKLGDRRAGFLEKAVLWLIVLVLGILFFEMLFASRLTRGVLLGLYAVDFSACMVFLYEFRLRYKVSADKRWFWRHNWVDLVSSIPIPPFLPTADLTTIARVARLFRILRLLRAARIIALLWAGIEKLDRVADVRMMQRSFITVGALMLVGAFVVQIAEGIPVASSQMAEVTSTEFTRYSEAVWWTFNTIATGGFADLYKPVQPFTRLITGVLILGGFVVLGVFIATLSAAYRGEDAQEIQRNQRFIQDAIEQLKDRQRDLNRRIDNL